MDEAKQTLLEVRGVDGAVGSPLPDPEVAALAKRRRFSAKYKWRILRAAAACKASGEVGTLLRQEGLYSSHLTHWRWEIEAHGEVALRAKRRRPKFTPPRPRRARPRRARSRCWSTMSHGCARSSSAPSKSSRLKKNFAICLAYPRPRRHSHDHRN